MENLRKEKLQGHIIRSRAHWIEQGEKPSRYFCKLESRNFLNKTIKKIEVEGTGMVYEQSEVLEHVKNYYENLYTCVDSNLVNVDLRNILYINTPKLDKQLASGLERDIIEAEVLSETNEKQ